MNIIWNVFFNKFWKNFKFTEKNIEKYLLKKWQTWTTRTLVQNWNNPQKLNDFRYTSLTPTPFNEYDRLMACWKRKWLNLVYPSRWDRPRNLTTSTPTQIFKIPIIAIKGL